MPGARCTGGLACKIAKKRTRAYRFSGGNPAFPAQWFYGLLRALPGDQACLTPSPALLIADLTPASGRQNDTTWPYASGRARLARCRVHRIPTRVRDVRETPLCGSDRRISELIWVPWQAKFLKFRKLIATLCCGMTRQRKDGIVGSGARDLRRRPNWRALESHRL